MKIKVLLASAAILFLSTNESYSQAVTCITTCTSKSTGGKENFDDGYEPNSAKYKDCTNSCGHKVIYSYRENGNKVPGNIAFSESGNNINKVNIEYSEGIQVNSFTGNLFYQRTDLQFPGFGPLMNLTFYYNGATTALDNGYGPGWFFAYSMKVIPDINTVAVWHGDGRKDVFTRTGNAYMAPAGIFDTLEMYEPGKYRLTNKGGTSYEFGNSLHRRVTKIVDRNSNQLTISYADSLPTTITDASGRFITLNYTNGHLAGITDANMSPARNVAFVYDSQNNPIKVINPLGIPTKYEYDGLSNMTKVTNQLSNSVSITYNNCVTVSNISSPGKTMAFAFDTTLKQTTVNEVVNGINRSTSYKYDLNGDLVEKTGNCCGFHVLQEFGVWHNLIKKTDANGNIHLYESNSKGSIVKETDPAGKFEKYTYEPVYNKITSVKDKNGDTTFYSYDVHGNLLQVLKPLGVLNEYTYNGQGQVTSYKDGNGNITQFSYNSYGYLINVTYPDGATNSSTYDNVGNQLSNTDANGHTTYFTYNGLNQLTQRTDALGHTTAYTYNAAGWLTSVTNALGEITSYTYNELGYQTSKTTSAGTSYMTNDEKGNLLTYTDNMGNVTHYSYNAQNLLENETNALGHSRNFTYDANGNRITETDFNGNLTTYTYNALNKVTTVTDALSHNTTYAYDNNGNTTAVTDANGHTTTFVIDALGRTIQVQRPIGTISYGYDANNNRTTVTDENGHSTTYMYNNRNRQTAATDASGHIGTTGYDAQGNLVSSTDRNGFITTYTYDAINQQTAQTNPVGETTTSVYDAVGGISTRTMPNGNTLTYTYDAAGRLISVLDNLGIVSTNTYDANSNRITQTDPHGHITTSTYDAINRMTQTTDPMGHSSIFGYDNNSNVTSTTDRDYSATYFQYDVLGRKVFIGYPEGNTVTATYDAVGNTMSKTDDNGHATTYAYDANDRLITETYADGSVKHFTYDAKGNTMSRIDNNGNTTYYTYNALDRLTSRNYPGTNDDTFSYDNEGRIISANNNNASITYTYDNANRILGENMNGKTTSYTYNIPNKKRTVAYPGGRNIEEVYDHRTRLSFIKENSNNLAIFTYDAGNRMLSRWFNNGVSATYSYNNNDWVWGLVHAGTSTIAGFNYSFNNEGNRLTAEKTHHSANSEKYTYDANERLVNYKEGTLSGGNISSPVTQTQYNYDGVGNRTTMIHDALTTTYMANTVNEYTSINAGSGINPTYDANGNTLNDGSHTYGYDYENRLFMVDGGTTATYKYDALGRRVQKVTSGGTINYLYDGKKVIEERNAASLVQATYVFGAGIDEVLHMRRGGTDCFFHQNSLGSVAAVTDNSGSAVERYEYDAYGKPAIYDGSYSSRTSTAIGNTYMFTGREYDVEIGIYYYRARHFNANFGRFSQRDPLGIIGDINLYSYCSNNAINYSDPNGLEKVGGYAAWEACTDNCVRRELDYLDHCTDSWSNAGMCAAFLSNPGQNFLIVYGGCGLDCAGGGIAAPASQEELDLRILDYENRAKQSLKGGMNFGHQNEVVNTCNSFASINTNVVPRLTIPISPNQPFILSIGQKRANFSYCKGGTCPNN